MTLRRRLAALTLPFVLALALAAAPAAAQTAGEIRAVQAWLNEQGYDAGPADGMMGGRTRSAIELWEIEHGRPATGELSDWIVTLATGETAPASEAVADDGADAAAGGDSRPSSVSVLVGDARALSGTGPLAFTEREDGAIVVTDGIPWRREIAVAPRIIEIASAEFGLFTATPESMVPVPLETSIVDVPGSTFVPLFLAYDREAAAGGSLADAAGITWRFLAGELRFELDGYVRSATAPGATITFEPDAVVLRGFDIAPR